jgi:tetratricopeptide (TPR) repeat protein
VSMELLSEVKTVVRDVDFNPMKEEERLKELLVLARQQKNRNQQEAIRKKLVKLYVSQGEYFKMAETPDASLAKRYLEKALSYQENHPVANYRLGYLYYRNGEYPKAVYHFDKAISGSPAEEINETQALLSNMFLVNCGIKIAKEAIREMNYIEENPHSNFERQRIEKYKQEVLVLDEHILDQMFYRKLENHTVTSINEEEWKNYSPDPNQVLLKSSNNGKGILFLDTKSKPLNPFSFYVLFGVLTAETFLNYEELINIVAEGTGQEISGDYIRQIFRRLKNQLPYWDYIIETKTIEHTITARNILGFKIKRNFTACVLCRAEDYLPGFD